MLGAKGAKQREYALLMDKTRHISKKLYWAKKYHKNTKGKPMKFRQSLFLVPIYKALDRHRKMMVIKSVQSGVSEALIVSHLEEASNGLSILYALPDQTLRNTFVQNRVNRVIQMVPHYRNILKSIVGGAKADSVVIKIFGKGVIKYVHSGSASQFVEFPADAIYLDEIDQMNQRNVAMAVDRLSASVYKLERDVGNPSIEDYGIHTKWGMSSQGVWHVRCPHCNEWQPLNWFTNVVREIGDGKYEAIDKGWWDDYMNIQVYEQQLRVDVQTIQSNFTRLQEANIYCFKCGKELDRFGLGEYVHRYGTSRSYKGFHINKIFGNPNETISALIKKFLDSINNETKLQLFFNSDLGMPYSSASSKISEKDLDLCNVSDLFAVDSNEEGLACAGIDVGKYFHIIIRKLQVINGEERKRLLYAGAVKSEAEVIGLMKRYNVKSAVIDWLPETRSVERLKEALSYLYSCNYKQPMHAKLNKEYKEMIVDRTTLMDEVKESVDRVYYANFINMKNHPEYYQHLGSSTRVLNPDNGRYEWRESNNPDHLFHSEVYCLLAFKVKLSMSAFEFFDKIAGNINKEDKRLLAIKLAGKPKGQVINNLVDSFYGDVNKRR